MTIRRSRSVLWATAVLLSACIVLLGNLATDLILGHTSGAFGFIDAPDVAVLHFIFTGLPFFALAARAERRSTIWIAAFVLSAAFWAYFNWQLWRDSLTGFAGGANIGLGIIMFASPLLILLILGVLSLFLKQSGNRTGG